MTRAELYAAAERAIANGRSLCEVLDALAAAQVTDSAEDRAGRGE